MYHHFYIEIQNKPVNRGVPLQQCHKTRWKAKEKREEVKDREKEWKGFIGWPDFSPCSHILVVSWGAHG